jgi:DNA repair exonuclease SbcCD nuclease subunit
MSERRDIVEAVKDLPDGKIRDILFKVLEAYCYPSFGSISKREFEIILFGELYTSGVLGKDVYEISRRLRISTSRVKRLLLEYGLRYKDKEDLREQLREALRNVIVDKSESDWVLIYIEDPYLYEYIQELLKEEGFVSDMSFNRSLLKIRDEALAVLLVKVLSREEIENVRQILEEKSINIEEAMEEYKKEYGIRDWMILIILTLIKEISRSSVESLKDLLKRILGA